MYNQIIDEKNFADKQNITPSGISNAFDTGIAKACGIEAAIIYNHICFWVQQNIIHEKNQYDGRTWTYMTYEEMILAMPYLTIKQVRLGVSKLLEAGLIVKGDYSQDRFVKPTYYAVVNESALVDSKKSYESAKRADRSAQMEPSRCPKGQLENPKRAALLIGTDNKYTDNKDNTSLKVSEKPEADASMPAKAGEKKKKVFPEEWSNEVLEVGQAIVEAMKEVKPNCKEPNASKLLKSIDSMMRLDRRTSEEILSVFRWAINDSFWSSSMFKPDPAAYLREKFDQLDSKMNSKPNDFNKIDRRLRDSSGKPIVDSMKDNLF